MLAVPTIPNRRRPDPSLAGQVADLREAVNDLANDVAFIKGGIKVIGFALIVGGPIIAVFLNGGHL